jgi:hypothetical protein
MFHLKRKRWRFLMIKYVHRLAAEEPFQMISGFLEEEKNAKKKKKSNKYDKRRVDTPR